MKLKLKNKKLLPGREFLLFLFFFFVSCSLWLMMTLNKYYETDIKIPLRVKKFPDELYAVSTVDEEITVKIRDRGTTLLNYKIQNFLPTTIEYKDFLKQSGRLTLSTGAMRKQIAGQLATSTEIISLSPDSIIYYTQESTQKYPVEIIGEISSAIQYEIGEIKITPDSVWVFGPQSATDTMNFVYTEPINKKELRDSLTIDVKLQSNKGVKYNPEKVNIKIPITPYTEKTFEKNIKGIGFPSNYTLKAFPSKAKVIFNVNTAQIDSVQAEDFSIGIMYGDIYGNKSDKVKLTLMKHPEGVRNIRIIPNEVEYLIEHQ
ncbi:MAG: YbbR-like domain-containing protein [Bacteroidaceae bacterium]|nr:YbbR-like domain-containing protein [Bacteroidaceae bacterium]